MKKINALTLILLGLNASTAMGMNFKSYIQPLKLPYQISTSQPPVLKFTAPGEMSVGLLRACGDGDVAHFASAHRDFDFAPHAPELKELDVTIGYWVVPEGEEPLPTSKNFFTIARKKAPIAEQRIEVINDGVFRPESHNYLYGTPVFKDGEAKAGKGFSHTSTSADQNGMALLAVDLINLHAVAKRSFGVRKNYRVYAGAFACLPDNDKTFHKTSEYAPSAIETNHVLSNPDEGLLKDVKSALDNLSVESSELVDEFTKKYGKIQYKSSEEESIYSKAYLATSQKPYQFLFSDRGSVELKSANSSWKAFIDIAKLKYPVIDPTETDPMGKYKAALKSSDLFSKFKTMNRDELSACQEMGLKTSSSDTLYKWESLPLNLSCKYFHNGNDLSNAFKALFHPGSVPSESAFHALKKDLASRFYVAAAFESVQRKMEEDSKVIVGRSKCFDKSPLIKKVLSSFPFEFKRDEATRTYSINGEHKNIHPEPLFALIDFKDYLKDDKVAVWGQLLGSKLDKFEPKKWSILIPLGNQKQLEDHEINKETFSKNSINIMLRIRSVGGSCPMFC